MILRCLTTAFTFVGAMIGAGFASGREIALYFGETSIFTPLLSGLFLGLFCYLFLKIGAMTDGNPENLWGKGKIVVDFAVRLGNTVTCCAMVAGSEEAIYSLFSIHGGGFITALICIVVVSLGAEKIKLSNFLIVPAIIIMILILFSKERSLHSFGGLSVYSAFSYCTMNVLSGGYLISKYSSKFTKRECALTAGIAGIILTLLLLCVYFSTASFTDYSMPLMEVAKVHSLAKLGYCVLYLSIFTTLTTSLSVASKDNPIFATLVVALSVAISRFGFKKIVDMAYPVLGAAGSIICLVYLFIYLKRTYFHKKILQ